MSDDTRPIPVIELRDVRFAQCAPYDCALEAGAFSIRPGEFALVETDRRAHRTPLADIVCGLIAPEEGAAFFQGADWTAMAAGESSEARFRIGRIFRGTGSKWISNLDMDENLTLAARYHGRPVDESFMARLEELGRMAGCWPLPEGRHGNVPRHLLQRVEWVRAFLNDPALVILEYPLRDNFDNSAAALNELTARALAAGAAILWVAAEGDAWQSAAPKSASKWRLHDGRLAAMEMT